MMSPFKNGAILLIVSALAFVPRSAIAQALQQPTIETNMDYVEAVTRSTTLAVNDLMAVFKMVLDSLPERVKVYPTESYFYFRFTHAGVRYAGDIRLEQNDFYLSA
jgi:hypothetical protein